MVDKLEACPFCGGEVETDRYGPDQATPEMAINCRGECQGIFVFPEVAANDYASLRLAWNQRVTPANGEQVERMECEVCAGTGWVCENHRDRPWDGHTDVARACGCGAGAPCQQCERSTSAAHDKGRFADWSTATLSAQCLSQAREQLDPEFSQFMTAVAARLAATPTEDARSRVKVLEEALSACLDAMEPSGACNGNGAVYRNGVTALGNKETDRHG